LSVLISFLILTGPIPFAPSEKSHPRTDIARQRSRRDRSSLSFMELASNRCSNLSFPFAENIALKTYESPPRLRAQGLGTYQSTHPFHDVHKWCRGKEKKSRAWTPIRISISGCLRLQIFHTWAPCPRKWIGAFPLMGSVGGTSPYTPPVPRSKGRPRREISRRRQRQTHLAAHTPANHPILSVLGAGANAFLMSVRHTCASCEVGMQTIASRLCNVCVKQRAYAKSLF